MGTDPFQDVDGILASGNAEGTLDYLIERFRRDEELPLLFEARLMKKRFELGLPLIQIQDSDSLPAESRSSYEQGMVDAAREVGERYLQKGNIPRAWPYLRAIGDQAPVIKAIEQAEPGDDVDAIIAIALQEGIHPAKGLELIHKKYGMCRTLTSFGMYAVQKDRERCISFLVQEIYSEIVDRIGQAIERREGERPETRNLRELMAGRDWLFGEYDYYVDTSHLVTVLPYCQEAQDRQTLRLIDELCEYGTNLAPAFQSKSQPPFEDTFVDYGEYVRAVLGEDVDSRIAHFRGLVETLEGSALPAETLVNLLIRLERYQQALDVSLEFLEGGGEGGCPTALVLCRLARNFETLKELAIEKRDVLSYVAASVEAIAEKPALVYD